MIRNNHAGGRGLYDGSQLSTVDHNSNLAPQDMPGNVYRPRQSIPGGSTASAMMGSTPNV